MRKTYRLDCEVIVHHGAGAIVTALLHDAEAMMSVVQVYPGHHLRYLGHAGSDDRQGDIADRVVVGITERCLRGYDGL